MMKTINYHNTSRIDSSNRKRRLKLPNYLIKRKILLIREKIIARKYGTIYLRKVYGQYYPSECNRYYRKKILRTFFEKLKTHWFEEKQVYRLLRRANTFYNERLTRKSFDGWKSWAKKVQKIKQQAHIMRYNYNEHLLERILSNWRTVTNCKKKNKLIKSNAIELYYSMYTLLLLLNFVEHLSNQIEENLIEMKSIFSGKFIILRKYIRRWRIYIIQEKNCRILRFKATNYYRAKMSFFYFAHWQRYVCYKRTKHEIVQLCRRLYKDGLVKEIVEIWKYKTRSKIIEKKHQLLAVRFYDDSMKQRLLKTWRRYVKHKLLGRNRKHKANFFYAMRLKQKIINALSGNVAHCKNTKLAIQKLKLFYQRLIVMTSWNKWTEIIEEKNDSELRDKLLLAISFYRLHIIRKYLAKLVGYKISKQKKEALKRKAVEFSKTFYCKKFLNTWNIEYREKKRVAMLEEKALTFFNDSLMHDAISRWIKSYNHTISMKAKYQKSVLHHERKISSKCFALWISFCNEKIRAENLIKEATEYYTGMLQRKIFNKLLENIARRKMKREKIRFADNFYNKNLVNKAFENLSEHCLQVKELEKKIQEFDKILRDRSKRKIIVQWKLYVHGKKCSRRRALMSVAHRRKKVCSKIFEKLKSYVNYKREKDIRLAYLKSGVKRIEENMKTIYFQKWRITRLHILKEKCKMFHADEFYEIRLKKKNFFRWQKFLIHHKAKRDHQSDLNNIMKYFILKKYLKIWYTKYQRLLEIHSKESWASKIYEMKIRYKYFIAWKYFAEICIREKQDIDTAKEFHKKLVIKEGLQHLIKIYLRNTELRFETHLRNVERNSSRKFELLRKYFNKWHKVVSFKTKNRLQTIKNQIDLENVIPTNSKIDDRKYVCNLIPRFIIPEFMKDEIKLRFGIGQYSNKIPFNANGQQKLEQKRILKAENSFMRQKLSKNVSYSQMHVSSQEKKLISYQTPEKTFKLKNKSANNQKFTSNDLMKPQHLRQNMKTMSPKQASRIFSPDSLKSESDSAKTYTVENPRYSHNVNDENSFRSLHCSELTITKCNKENNYKLLPPAAFYVPLKEL